MRAFYHNIVSVALSESLFEELVLTSGNDHNVTLISPHGNLFLIGNIDLIEDIEISESIKEYIVTDAGETKRTIVFKDGESSYGILVNENGTPNSTTGISPDDDANDEWMRFYNEEIGNEGQPVMEEKNVSMH